MFFFFNDTATTEIYTLSLHDVFRSLTAASALARKYDDDGPHLIYLPERDFSIDGFIAEIGRAHV